MVNTVSSQPLLIVEDNLEDYETSKRALRKGRFKNPIFHCTDGDDALDFLYHRGVYRDATKAPRPGMILLDLNLPGTDGHEVLEQVKGDAQLCNIPVVILTTSSDARDIASCYAIGANSYVIKPTDLQDVFQVMQHLQDYWFEVVVLPQEEP